MKFGHVLFMVSLVAVPVSAATITFGDEDCLGAGCYGANDPTLGASLTGLSANQVTVATNNFLHGFPFSPDFTDFSGTDQIFVGSTQTTSHDGYSNATQRIAGPQTFSLDYSSLVTGTIATFTLGIAADDFQFPGFGQPFTATVNGVVNTALTNQLNAVDLTGPVVQFFTIGLDPSVLSSSNILTISIDEGGDGGDGWAVDFLTADVTTASTAIPEPATLGLAGCSLGLALLARRKRAAR